MLHAQNQRVRELLLKGNFGLERESLRITPSGNLSHSPNPFPAHGNIVRDFSENQVEINTGLSTSPEAAVAEVAAYDRVIQRTLAELPEPELLWPFSNPPYILNEQDVPIAQWRGAEALKTEYREYLSDRYGRYKMTFSGIHFNYSFDEELLQASFEVDESTDFVAYKDRLYLDLAERCVAYGWIMTAITAASPMLDLSFVEEGKIGRDLFIGLGSVRCSEMGYWNAFTPVLDYSNTQAYANSIQRYIDSELIKQPSELYYPIRVKPRGAYGLDGIRAGNLSHIELRMIDLNPLDPAGIRVEDVFFGQLLLVWLASTPARPLSEKEQVQAAQNFKNAARFDLRTTKIIAPSGRILPVYQAALAVVEEMEAFYQGFPPDVLECLAFQKRKFTDQKATYAWQLREAYANDFVLRGVELARRNQKRALQEQD